MRILGVAAKTAACTLAAAVAAAGVLFALLVVGANDDSLGTIDDSEAAA